MSESITQQLTEQADNEVAETCKLRREIDRLKTELKKEQAQTKHLNGLLEKHASSYFGDYKPRVRLPSALTTPGNRGAYNRVIMPDVHGSTVNVPALEAFLSDLEVLKPRELVMIGDLIDCDGFLSRHKTLGHVTKTSYSFEQDVSTSNEILDKIASVAPQAKKYLLEGNHEQRISAWINEQVISHDADRQMLKKLVGPATLLHLETRGIEWFERCEIYGDLKVRGTIKLDKCHFKHGDRHGKNACSVVLKEFAAPVVFGHTHRTDMMLSRTVESGTVGAWSVGCLSELQPLYRHSEPTDWNHSYGLQICQESGDFLTILVPIIDGVSYLQPFLQMMGLTA